jgi:polyphosphate kinase
MVRCFSSVNLVSGEPVCPHTGNNTQAWELLSDGSYRRLLPGSQEPASAQVNLLRELAENPYALHET